MMEVSRFACLVFAIWVVTFQVSCSNSPAEAPEWGVSRKLAEERSSRIRNLSYQLSLEVPELRSDPIQGSIAVSFELEKGEAPLVLDFRQDPQNLRQVTANGREAVFSAVNGHIVIESTLLRAGANSITVDFLAGDGSLNRREDHLYTLFVPDRASVAIPCFDQPDLKASYQLNLNIPSTWTALANGPVISDQLFEGRRRLGFETTRPLSTYQFAFAAGVFQVEERQVGNRKMRLFHRETESRTVERNLEEIFSLHGKSIDWLEEYTGIPYPYQKFDFALLPAFQYGGMEHPGAIFYRDRGLWLDPAPTLQQTLSRASVIAHETAHMWFGNLVTMRWFDDVWTKEVYANFMAAKIANPIFPDMDHDLSFFLRHYPAAYAVDRTPGTNPIRQPLENLVEAGSLYGAIIYQKAPIVMRQLEDLLGEEKLRLGLQTYLQRFSYGNSSWPELVEILDELTDLDLAKWSQVWVEEPGRPQVKVVVEMRGDRTTGVLLSQGDPLQKGRIWTQPVQVGYRSGSESIDSRFLFSEDVYSIEEFAGKPTPDFILPNAGARAYGLFLLDPSSLDYLLKNLSKLPSDIERAVALADLWENLLEGALKPLSLMGCVTEALTREENELLLGQQLSLLRDLFWGFLSPAQRDEQAPDLEELLWHKLEQARSESQKASLFSTFRNIARSETALARLLKIWEDRAEPQGLKLSETDFIELSKYLTVAMDSEEILVRQIERTVNPDRKAELEFVRPALSPEPAVRDAFFESLKEDRNRDREPWVLDGLRYLHHPLRVEHSIQYLEPSLELLEEIQRTGDIFFPKGWLDATFENHRSNEAARIVEDFLESHPDFPPRLRAKILQSTDSLMRRARLLDR